MGFEVRKLTLILIGLKSSERAYKRHNIQCNKTKKNSVRLVS